MVERKVMPASLVEDTRRDQSGELVDDQGGKGRGKGRKTTVRLHQSEQPSRSRNLVIPDDLYDEMCLYAVKTKVKEKTKKGIEYSRSLTMSEAWCKAARSFLLKNGGSEVDRPAVAE